jgi:predicted Mrr-cat superfamily restriction endonuclease
MLIAKIGNTQIMAGDTVDIKGVDNFKFAVLEVLPHSFKVKWLTGDGGVDNIPHSLFADLDAPITVIEVPDKEDDPNRAFMKKKGVF